MPKTDFFQNQAHQSFAKRYLDLLSGKGSSFDKRACEGSLIRTGHFSTLPG